MNSIANEIRQRLLPLSDVAKAQGAKAYMKNQFEFLGIQTPLRRKVCKDFLKELGLLDHNELAEAVRHLWAMPEREMQYCAIELITFNKKVWQQEVIEVTEFCITNKSWWDTVDFICTDVVSPYFKIFPARRNEITGPWNRSKNIWLQRSSLLSQKGYKKETDVDLLSAYILKLAESKEFFVQKAIGCVLREYARVDGEWVKKFVHQHKLAALSKREALKHL